MIEPLKKTSQSSYEELVDKINEIIEHLNKTVLKIKDPKFKENWLYYKDNNGNVYGENSDFFGMCSKGWFEDESDLQFLPPFIAKSGLFLSRIKAEEARELLK